MITITLNKIRAHSPCKSGWEKLLRHLGKTQADDDEFPLSVVLDSNGLYDALWCCRCLPEYDREWRLFAVWCARRVQHLMTDPRSIAAIDVAERYAIGDASDDELLAAWAAAGVAAWFAAGYGALAARAAARATEVDAGFAASPAARAARAARAALDAWADAGDTLDAGWDAALAEQEAEFRKIIS